MQVILLPCCMKCWRQLRIQMVLRWFSCLFPFFFLLFSVSIYLSFFPIHFNLELMKHQQVPKMPVVLFLFHSFVLLHQALADRASMHAKVEFNVLPLDHGSIQQPIMQLPEVCCCMDKMIFYFLIQLICLVFISVHSVATCLSCNGV